MRRKVREAKVPVEDTVWLQRNLTVYGHRVSSRHVSPQTESLPLSIVTDLEAWKEYCEAGLDLSNQDDIEECPEMFDLVWPSWIEPDEDE